MLPRGPVGTGPAQAQRVSQQVQGGCLLVSITFPTGLLAQEPLWGPALSSSRQSWLQATGCLVVLGPVGSPGP